MYLGCEKQDKYCPIKTVLSKTAVNINKGNTYLKKKLRSLLLSSNSHWTHLLRDKVVFNVNTKKNREKEGKIHISNLFVFSCCLFLWLFLYCEEQDTDTSGW